MSKPPTTASHSTVRLSAMMRLRGGASQPRRANIAGFGSLKGDIHAHFFAFLGVRRLRRIIPRPKDLIQGRSESTKTVPSLTPFNQAQSLSSIGGVDHHQIFACRAMEDEGIGDDIGLWIKEVRVAGFAHAEGADVVAQTHPELHRTRLRPGRRPYAPHQTNRRLRCGLVFFHTEEYQTGIPSRRKEPSWRPDFCALHTACVRAGAGFHFPTTQKRAVRCRHLFPGR